MDYNELSRKELQALCKKHGIPANLKNLDMASRLSSLLKEDIPTKRGKSCLKNLDNDKLLENKEPKRVKFSPQNETFVFEKTDPLKLRLLARTTRASGKSQFEDNPVLVSGIVDDDDVVGDLEKPAKRTSSRRKSVVSDPVVVDTDGVHKPVQRVSRRKSVVPCQTEVLETGKLDKPVQRVSRRKPDVPDLAVVSDTENVDKPAHRVSRRKSVLPDPTEVSDTEKFDKPVQRVSRRKSVVPDPAVVLDTEIVDKPVQRVSRRKPVVPDPAVVLDIDNVDQPAQRVSRRKSVVPNPITGTENIPEVKAVQRVSRQKSVVCKPINEVVDEVEKPAGRNLRTRASKVKADEVLSSEVIDNAEKPMQKVSRRKSVVAKPIGVVDTDVAIKVDKPAKRTTKRKHVQAKQSATSDTEIVNEMEKPAKRALRSVVVQPGLEKVVKPAQNEKKHHVKDNLMSPAVKKTKSRRKGLEKVGQGAVEKVDRPPDELVGLAVNNKMVERSLRTDMATDIPENGDNVVQADEVEARRSLRHVPNDKDQGDTMASEGQRIQDRLDQSIDEKNAQGKSPDMVAEINEPKQDEKKGGNCVGQSLSVDYSEEMVFMNKNPQTEVKAFSTPINRGGFKIQNSGEHAAENSIQSNNVQESQELHQNICAANMSDTGPASASPSLLKIDMSGTLFGPREEKNCAGEPTCKSALISSISGSSELLDSGHKRSGSLTDMRDNGIYGSAEGLDCFYQIKNEELIGQENGCEVSPCLTKSFKFKNAAEEENTDCAAVDLETSEVQSTKIEGTDVSEGSRDVISGEKVVGQVAVTETSLQPPIVVDEMTFASNVSLATINKIMKKAKEIETVTPLANQRTNLSSRDANDSYLFQSLSKDDGESKAEPSSINTFISNLESLIDDELRVISFPMREGEECAQETIKGDIACVENTIRVKNLTEEDSPIILEQLNEMDMKLEVQGDELINDGEGKEMNCKKAIMVTTEDTFGMTNGGKTSGVVQESKWTRVVDKSNISPGPVLDMDEDMKSISDIDCAESENFKEREVSDTSNPRSAVSCLDVRNICIELSDQIASSDTIVTQSDQEFHLNDDKSSDHSAIWQKRLQPLENHCSNFVSPSRKNNENSMMEESQMVIQGEEKNSMDTRSGGLNCSANNVNLEYVGEGHEFVTVMKPEEPRCSNEFKSDCLVSEEDISSHAQSKDHQCEMVTWSSEEITIYSVAKEVANLAEETGHANEAEGAISPGNKSPEVTNCNELDQVLGTEFDWQNSVAKEEVNLAQEPGIINDAEGAISPGNESPESTHCNELEEIPGTEFDWQKSESDTVEKDVENFAQEAEHANEAEGAISPGYKSPESTNCDELDEVLGTEFDWTTKSAGLIKKEFKNDIQQLGSVEVAKMVVNVNDKESSKTSTISLFDATVENNALASQSNFLIAIPEAEESETNYGDQRAKMCLREDIAPGHFVGFENAATCVDQLEMTEGMDSPKNTETLLHDNLASGIDDKSGSIMVACPLLDSSPCNSNAHLAMCESASDTFSKNKCHQTLENASICDVEGLCSIEPMLLENEEDIKGNMDENNLEKSDALSSKSPKPSEIMPQASVSKVNGGSESMYWEKESEFSSATEMDLQDFTNSPFSVANSNKDDTKYNLDNVSPSVMADPLSFGKKDELDGEVQEAVDNVSEEQIGNRMNAENVKGQESVSEGNIGYDMEAIEEDNCVEANDILAPSTDVLDRLPCDVSEVSDVAIDIEHMKSINSDAETEFNINEGKSIVDQKVISEELVDGRLDSAEKDSYVVENDHSAIEEDSDNVKTSPCSICTMDSIPEHLVSGERKISAHKDNIDAVDSPKSPDLRDVQDDKGCSVVSEENEASVLPMFSAPIFEPFISIHNTTGTNMSKAFVDASDGLEMAQEASIDNPFTLLEEQTDDWNSVPHREDGSEKVIHAGRDPNSPKICDNKEVKNSFKGITLPHSTEECDKFAEADFAKPLETHIGSVLNCYDASDNRAKSDFSSPNVPENLTDQLQQQNHSPLMPSCQQADPSRSAYQSDTATTALLDNENLTPYVESFISTDSEIDLFWEEVDKDGVRTLQTEDSDAKSSVDEYDITNLENKRQERVGDNVGKVENNHKSVNGEETENSCPLDANNSRKVAEKDCVLLSSTVRRKNTRSILIHGTPKKPVPFVHDMKENPPTQKRVEMVNATVIKPNMRRKALDDIAK